MNTLYRKTITGILFFIFHFSFFTPIVAQTDTLGEKKTVDGYMMATYIFEGKIDSTKYFTVKTGEYSYQNFYAYLVEVTKVIKGNIQTGTVEILQHAPGITYQGPDGGAEFQPRDGPGNPPSRGIYLCWNKDEHMTHSYYANTNGKSLRRYGEIPVTGDGKIPQERFGISFYFSTLSDFYNYISANYGVKIEDK
jgi:hypothetical protein